MDTLKRCSKDPWERRSWADYGGCQQNSTNEGIRHSSVMITVCRCMMLSIAWDGGKSTSAISNCSARVADLEKSWRTNPPIAQGFSSAPCHRKQGTLRRLRNHRSSPPVWAWWGSLPGHTRIHLSPFSFADFPLAALFKTRALNEGGLAGDFVARNWGHWGILRALERAAVWLWKINDCGITSQPSWIHRHIPTSLSRASSKIWLTALPTFSDLPVEFKVIKCD